MSEIFSIRPATSDDLQTLSEIEKRVHKSPWTVEHFQAEISKSFSKLWVMTDDETDQVTAGYVCFWMMDDHMQILNVAVDLPYRSLGYAKKMIQAVIRDALQDEMKRITLDVRMSNENAIGLYRKIGFADVSVRKNFYSDGESAITMDLLFDITQVSGSS